MKNSIWSIDRLLRMLCYTLLCSFSLIFSSFAAAAVPTPAVIRLPSGDPCGPLVQDNPDYPNTCNAAPALVESPQPYGINCTQVYDPDAGSYWKIYWGQCISSLDLICTKMEDTRTLAGMWIWVAMQPQCALGFFLPPYKDSASRPSMQRCLDIFNAMENTCSTTTLQSNFASINLKTLPGYDPSHFDGGENVGKGWPQNEFGYDGSAVNVGYPSYAITFKKVNSQY